MPIDLPPVSAPVPAASAPAFDEQYARARTLANTGQLELALAAYDALLVRSPGNADVLLGRGVVTTHLQRWREAEADLMAAVSAAPAYADAWSALGNVYLWTDRPRQAAEAYDRVLALRPDDADAAAARGRARRALAPRTGNPDAAAAGYSWLASIGTGWTEPGVGPRWNDQTLSLRHYTARGSTGFETLRAHRFGRHDVAWALDGYANLWQRAYANLRYQRAPASRLFPANAGRVEVYQAFGNGWELSASDDVLGFASRVNIYGATLARYTGDFYLQWRHQRIVARGAGGSGERLLGRWYYLGDADSYVEASINGGRSDDPLTLVGGQAHSGGGGAAWVRYWTPRWGTRVAGTYARATGAGDERGLSFALYRRW